jgi:hypothetical protein
MRKEKKFERKNVIKKLFSFLKRWHTQVVSSLVYAVASA